MILNYLSRLTPRHPQENLKGAGKGWTTGALEVPVTLLDLKDKGLPLGAHNLRFKNNPNNLLPLFLMLFYLSVSQLGKQLIISQY